MLSIICISTKEEDATVTVKNKSPEKWEMWEEENLNPEDLDRQILPTGQTDSDADIWIQEAFWLDECK